MDAFYTLSHHILLKNPDSSWTTSALIWVVRIVTLSLLLRTYIVPWLLSIVLKHFRIRSISLRSLRGLYIRRGNLTCRAERVSYVWPSMSDSGRFTVKIEGLNLEIFKFSGPPVAHRMHKRALTFANLSEFQYRSWDLFWSIVSLFDPVLRPILRNLIVGALRLVIHRMPNALTIEFHNTSLSFPGTPRAHLKSGDIVINASLELKTVQAAPLPQASESLHPPRRSYSMAAWRTRMRNGLARSLGRALDNTTGMAQISLNLRDFAGVIRSAEQQDTPVFSIPGGISLNVSLPFDPKGGIGAHSLKTHLQIGECSSEISELMVFLDLFRPPKPPAPSSPAPSSPDTPLSTFIFPNSPPPSSLFPNTPMSPLLEAISVRLPMRLSQMPCRRLQDIRNEGIMSYLESFTVRIAALKFSSSHGMGSADETYLAAIQHVSIKVGLSNAKENQLHRRWLGCPEQTDHLTPEIYSTIVSVRQMTLDRTSGAKLRLATVGKVEVQLLGIQWPSPWLKPLPFFGGDANAAIAIVRVMVEAIDMQERTESFYKLADRLSSQASPSVPSHASKILLPRFTFELECGPISSSLVSDISTIELKTDGLVASISSRYAARHSIIGHPKPTMNEDFDHFPLNLSLTVQAILNPTFVRIRSSGPPEIDSSDDLSLFSMDALELNAGGSILATIRDDTESAASADMSSTIIDFFCTSDAVSVELWNPKVVEGLVACLKSLPTRTAKPQIHKAPILDRLPGGLTGAFSLFRVVFVATSPDLNLKNSLELSRGIALRATAISLQYSSMRPIHAYRFKHLPHRAQTRHLLGLPEERLMEAVSEARTSGITHSVSAFLAVSCSDISVRSSISTQYATDEPLIAEGDDPKLSHRDFLQIIGLRSDLTLSGKRGSTLTTMPDSCQVSIRVPYVHGTFRILHLYSTLLASQTLRRLVNAKPPVVRISPESATSSFQLSYTVTGALRTVQVLCLLPKQRIALRVDSITAKMALNSPTEVHWHRAVGWVPLASRINKWQTDVGEQWHELVCLRRWSMFLQSSPSSISVEGHSLHFHIPFGYVLANLIQDVGVTVKVLRHLIRITNSGRYSAMGFPQPEGPKVVPTVSFHISCICAEAHDDWLDSKLNNIWRCGVTAVPMRADREEAFLAKVAAVIAAEYDDDEQPAYGFSSRHSVSVEEARHRLDQVHVLDWMLRLENLTKDQTEAEDKLKRHLQGASPSRIAKSIPDIVKVVTLPEIPPLFRAVLDGLSLTISPPSFAMVDLPQFLHDQGGLKTDTEYSLLVPLHINFTLSSLRVTLRDYPLPLIDVPAVSRGSKAALEFDSDVVIAEEMGTEFSIDWVKCPIIDDSEAQTDGSVPFFSMVPKTIMPVKSYANAEINVTTSGSSTFAWAVSYGPAIQDLMRIVDTLSNSPRDPSPAIGFWDKMRLILHWTIKATFKGDVYYYIKGTRDPYQMLKSGAGFVLVFQGHPELLIGRQNDDRELVQLTSGSMLIAIPDLGPRSRYSRKPDPDHYPFTKICAKFRAGVRFGVGLVLERACGPQCGHCTGPSFHRACRFFDFRPHHQVKLENRQRISLLNGPEDSYAGFRSEFIHMSISLTSSLDATKSRLQAPSSLHLTPQSFAHFWSWWTLFEGALSLPIRQGTYFPARVLSPKFGRHIATIKYRLTVPKLFVMHGYMDESPETWMDAVTPWIGVKAMIDELQVDMHQREQEMLVSASSTNKKNRRKPFYAAEVVLKGLDLRAVLSTFPDPLKQTITVLGTHERSNYRSQQDLPVLDLSSFWYDPDDFIELDWSPKERPTLHILPFVECPQFMYFKRNTATVEDDTATSKFGNEDTHRCLLGKEPSAPQVQIALATARVHELKDAIQHGRTTTHGKGSSLQKMVSLLEQYIAHLEETESGQVSTTNHYQMPSDTVSPDEWAEFDNVYHIHCPKIVMDTAIRDIMMQYYYCSRSRRGVEYHMATRAVKFIRDQAEAGLARGAHVSEKYKGSANTAQAAALALRKMLIGDDGNTPQDESKLDILDPLNGWSEGVSLTKSHCCLLLKPQIVLKNRDAAEETCIVAAVQAKLQSFAIMDDYNADDPISGKVMSRTYTLLSGLQTFAPTKGCRSNDNSVPLEVLIDFRCESSDFDRLVPQADATFHYDKFNRLRLRNNVTSVISRHSSDSPGNHPNHLQDQTDLIQIHIPRFTVMANEANFQTISNIVSKLLLFSDAAHKTRLDTLETMLFTYDFTDLGSQAAKLVSDLQGRLRASLESQNDALFRTALGDEAEHITTPPLSDMELLSMRYHISTAYQHLAMIFDVIKLAQDRHDEQGDQKSALLVNASSSEISWRMLDDNQDLLAKLAVQDIDYSWLSRQDSTTVNNLTIGNLQAFDGSANAKWTEILSKYDDFSGHALAKRGLFLMSNWVVLPPVAGITIYESFELTLHPIRLQVDAKVGSRIMEYLYPSRRQQRIAMESIPSTELVPRTPLPPRIQAATRASLDSPRPAYSFSDSLYTDSSESLAPPPLRRLGVSRSFTDLRTSAAEYLYATAPGIQRTRSTEALQPPDQGVSPLFETTEFKPGGVIYKRPERTGDAAEMKTRSSQKSFVMVKVSSLSLLLSIMKEDSFVCRDARIRTRDLEYHNQTWSFEELVDQFIPSDMSWKGWVKMALHQPLVPVLPVARELIAKTKWLGSRAEVGEALDSFPGARAITFGAEVPSPAPSPPRLLKQTHFLTSEPEPVSEQHPSRKRVRSLFSRTSSKTKKTESESKH